MQFWPQPPPSGGKAPYHGARKFKGKLQMPTATGGAAQIELPVALRAQLGDLFAEVGDAAIHIDCSPPVPEKRDLKEEKDVKESTAKQPISAEELRGPGKAPVASEEIGHVLTREAERTKKRSTQPLPLPPPRNALTLKEKKVEPKGPAPVELRTESSSFEEKELKDDAERRRCIVEARQRILSATWHARLQAGRKEGKDGELYVPGPERKGPPPTSKALPPKADDGSSRNHCAFDPPSRDSKAARPATVDRRD